MRKLRRGLSDNERVLVASAGTGPELLRRLSIPCGGDRARGNSAHRAVSLEASTVRDRHIAITPVDKCLTGAQNDFRIRVRNSTLLHNFAGTSRACPNRQKTWLVASTVITWSSKAYSISFEALMPLKPTVHRIRCLSQGFWMVSDPRCFVGERRVYEYCHTRQRLP